MAKKRKTLPKDFEELLVNADLDTLKKVFDQCEIDAYSGFSKKTAIAFDNCPDELVRWLVGQGADLNRPNHYGDTPLHQRARSRQGTVAILLELGAGITVNTDRSGTPLHAAARGHNVTNAGILLQFGAHVNEKDPHGMTPLETALEICSNIDIINMVELAELLLESGAKKTPGMKTFVKQIGERFEFHRSGFNKDFVEAFSLALEKLYEIFQVPPVQRRVLHDGKSKIIIKEKTWQKQFEELWELLVPSSGHTMTVQGEAIRIAGRISDEIEGNGGINWDADYKKMGKMFLKIIQTEDPLSIDEIKKAKAVLMSKQKLFGNTESLVELAVKWVIQNREPVLLEKPDYSR